jgi:acetyl/propionyl-CoA carboxylase alpha subunit
VASVTLNVGIGEGPTHQVELTRSGRNATVWIDGTAYPVTVDTDADVTYVEMEGRRMAVWHAADRDDVFLHALGRAWTAHVTDPVEASLREGAGADHATAPMPGTIVSISAAPGDEITRGDVLAVLESMKMHSDVVAPRDGVVDRVLVGVGDVFDQGATLITLVPVDESEPGEG